MFIKRKKKKRRNELASSPRPVLHLTVAHVSAEAHRVCLARSLPPGLAHCATACPACLGSKLSPTLPSGPLHRPDLLSKVQFTTSSCGWTLVLLSYRSSSSAHPSSLLPSPDTLGRLPLHLPPRQSTSHTPPPAPCPAPRFSASHPIFLGFYSVFL